MRGLSFGYSVNEAGHIWLMLLLFITVCMETHLKRWIFSPVVITREIFLFDAYPWCFLPGGEEGNIGQFWVWSFDNFKMLRESCEVFHEGKWSYNMQIFLFGDYMYLCSCCTVELTYSASVWKGILLNVCCHKKLLLRTTIICEVEIRLFNRVGKVKSLQFIEASLGSHFGDIQIVCTLNTFRLQQQNDNTTVTGQ